MPAQSLKALHADYSKDADSKPRTDEEKLITKGNGYAFAPELFEEEDDFNTRGAFLSKEEYFKQPKIKAHIRKLADSYKNSVYVPPLIVKVRDGRLLIRDGHCRIRAIRLAISEGAEITRVRVEEMPGDEAAQTLLIVTSNDGAPLSVLERAVVFGRLKGYGWDIKKIASHVGVTQENVRNVLKMLELPLDLKQLIQREKVSATYALELFNEHGTQATAMILKGLEEQEEGTADNDAEPGTKPEKGPKVTKKKIDAGPRLTKKVVTAMHNSFVSMTSELDKAQATDKGTFLLEISPDTMDLLNKLKADMAAKQADDTDPNQLPLV